MKMSPNMENSVQAGLINWILRSKCFGLIHGLQDELTFDLQRRFKV
jgi:hypothetical protein